MHVSPGAKRFSVAGDHDGSTARIGFEFRPYFGQAPMQFGVGRIRGLGTIEAKDPDGVLSFNQQDGFLIGHATAFVVVN
jgi:hypothetical protein